MSVPIVIYTVKNFYLINELNEKIDIMRAAGLVEYWYSLQFSQQFSKNKENPPKVLNISQLSGCFQIWAGGLIVSSGVFLLELFIGRWK